MEKEIMLYKLKRTMKALYNACKKEDGILDIVQSSDHISITWDKTR